MMIKTYKFDVWEALWLAVLLMSAPAAFFGVGRMFAGGSVWLGLSELDWQIWVTGSIALAAVCLLFRQYQPMLAAGFLLMGVLTASMRDPSIPMDETVAADQVYAWLLEAIRVAGVYAPGIAAAIGCVYFVSRAMRSRRANKPQRNDGP